MSSGWKKKRERDRAELQDFPDGRAKRSDVTARVVGSKRRRAGDKFTEHQPGAQGSPAPRPPLPNYDRLSVADVYARVDDLTKNQLAKLIDYEQKNKNRKTLLRRMTRALSTRG